MRLNYTDIRRGRRRGSALVIVMCLAGILMIAGAAMTFMAGNSAFKARKMQTAARALSTAEGGIADMLSRMSTNYYGWANSSFTINYDQGTCTVVSKLYTNNGHVLITSTATIEGEKRTTVLELLGNIWDVYDYTVGQYGAIIAGGDVTIGSGAVNCYGGVHANGNVYLSVGNPRVDGDVTSSGPTNEITPNGTQYIKSANTPLVDVPNLWTNINEWRALAMSGGLYYSAGLTTTVDQVPGNGVIYVVGNAALSKCNFTGVLIATGDITIDNLCRQYVYGTNTNWPCLIAGGNISESQQNSYWGTIWAKGNIELDNRRLVHGTIISYSGNVDVKNNMDLYPLPASPDWAPSDTNDLPPQLLIGGWLQ